jgi:hypothetical protein
MPRFYEKRFESMRKIASLVMAAVFVLGLSAVSMAGINRREYRELTRREAGRLEAGLARIKTDERFARMSGGGISPRERARLEREMNRESRAIYRQKHDGQDRIP